MTWPRVEELGAPRSRDRESPRLASYASCLRRWGQIYPKEILLGKEYMKVRPDFGLECSLDAKRSTSAQPYKVERVEGYWGNNAECLLCAGQFIAIFAFSSQNVPVTEHLFFHILPNSWNYETFSVLPVWWVKNGGYIFSISLQMRWALFGGFCLILFFKYFLLWNNAMFLLLAYPGFDDHWLLVFSSWSKGKGKGEDWGCFKTSGAEEIGNGPLF